MDWWNSFSDFTVYWIDPIGIWLGVVATVPIVWSWVLLLRAWRQRKAVFAQIRREPGERPGVLIVDLLPQQDIRANVEKFRRQQAHLAAIPPERIVTLRRDRPITADEMVDFHRELRKAIGRLSGLGVDRVHLFLGVPVPVAAVVGAHLANTFQVVLYHWQGGIYENWGPLKDFRVV